MNAVHSTGALGEDGLFDGVPWSEKPNAPSGLRLGCKSGLTDPTWPPEDPSS